MTKLKNLKMLPNSNCDKTQKFKLWPNFSQIVTKLELYKSQFVRRKTNLKGLLVRKFWHLDNGCDVLWAAFCDSRDVLILPNSFSWRSASFVVRTFAIPRAISGRLSLASNSIPIWSQLLQTIVFPLKRSQRGSQISPLHSSSDNLLVIIVTIHSYIHEHFCPL